tara:strand:- start:831 stop:1046 length:216 start_codon:yes stop_codon:yes gene_type:complete
MKIEVREATGADWVWLMTYASENDKSPSHEKVIARMVTSLDEEGALALPVGTFRKVFAECSRAIVGDDESD